jgi:decaprenylphospho-beta-D-erythro-pentofuranosid-2-ulose 2-reductase
VTQILILGATSGIAQAYARRRAAQGCGFILAGRREDRLAAIAADLKACGAPTAEQFVIDLAAMDGIEASVGSLRGRFGEPDEVLVAYGSLGEQAAAEQDLALARALIDTNFTSAALWILALLKDRQTAIPFTVVGIGSVAGDRGRASNFIYGSAKGALDRFLQGLAQKYDGTAVRVITVKPGFVDTPMTAGIAKGGPLWATPDQIAADIERAVAKGKRVVYTPWFWWVIMMIIRHLPWFVFKRLKV